MILVYTLVFSEVMKARMPDNTGSFAYSIYLCSGVLTWGLFTEMLGNDSNLLIVFYVQIMPDDLVMQLHRF